MDVAEFTYKEIIVGAARGRQLVTRQGAHKRLSAVSSRNLERFSAEGGGMLYSKC